MAIFSAVRSENTALPQINQWVTEVFSALNPGALYIHTSGKQRFKCTQKRENLIHFSSRSSPGRNDLHGSLLQVFVTIPSAGLCDGLRELCEQHLSGLWEQGWGFSSKRQSRILNLHSHRSPGAGATPRASSCQHTLLGYGLRVSYSTYLRVPERGSPASPAPPPGSHCSPKKI